MRTTFGTIHLARRWPMKADSFEQQCTLDRRPSIQMRLQCAQMRSRSTLVDPNAFPMCSDVLSHDVCQSKCVSCLLRCALARRTLIQIHFCVFRCAIARRLSIKMHILYAEMHSRSLLVNRNAFSVRSKVFSLDAQYLTSDLLDFVAILAHVKLLLLKDSSACPSSHG